MKTTRIALGIILLMTVLFAAFGAEGAHPIFATTIDFLDYVFFDKEGPEDVYPVEVYERRIREIADLGFRKIYLRVNALGLTLYPTKVALLYGEGYAYHWSYPKGAARLTKTVRAYDVCNETIRLGHKYGMEVWAWESLSDGGTDIIPADGVDAEAVRATRNLPLNDPFYVAHPEYYTMRDPKKTVPREQVAATNRHARAYPVGRIVATETVRRIPLRLTQENIRLYVSDDNRTYRPYEGPLTFRGGVTAEGFNTFTLDNLNIDADYVKIGHTPLPKDGYSFVMYNNGTNMQVFNTRGEPIAATWRYNNSDKSGTEGALAMKASGDCALDYGSSREVGFLRGLEDGNLGQWYVLGIHEFAVPETMAHQTARFAELAAYPFDGFYINFGTHSREEPQDQLGYNDAIRQIYLQKYGVDIWKEEADPKKILLIRANAIADFFVACKKCIGRRPLYVNGLPPVPLGERAAFDEYNSCIKVNMLPSLYRRYLAEDRSVDGIMMCGGNFADHFTPEITGGRDIRLGLCREGAHMRVNSQKGTYDIDADLHACHEDARLSEVELYEALEFTANPAFQKVLIDITGGRQK